MVYIEIIYLILYSIVCFLVVRNIHRAKVNEIYDDYTNKLEELNTEFVKLKNKMESNFSESKNYIVEQNKQYLSRMNKDISKQLKELSDNVRNKHII